MVQSRRRVSYVVPPPIDPVPRLQLPSSGIPRIGSIGPLLLPSQDQNQSAVQNTDHRQPLPKQPKHPRHRLSVACLALDTSTFLAGRTAPEGILYTGGRDGMVMSWELGIPMKKRRSPPPVRLDGAPEGVVRRPVVGRWEIMTGWADEVIDEEADEADERPGSDGDILGEVSTGNSRRKRWLTRKDSIPFEEKWETDLDAFKPEIPARFRQCAQTHTDWVNDILLCNYNQTVISASSDGTIKSWNPHSLTSPEPSTIGSHSDYVRCLAYCREKNWLASGSFDRTVKLWDLNRSTQSVSPNPLMTLNPPDTTMPKASVYAIAVDPCGSTIASGTPERVVRMWDPRTGKRTGKLVGHTDNIRAILISEDSRYLLTGSADASIKLWSLLSQRCLHTFTYHTDSVWSLFSTHPSLEVFYSGDKSGLVCRVDIEDCSDVSEGECIVLCQDTGTWSMASSEGVNKILVMDDNLLWTASGSSRIKRWRVPQRRSARASALVLDGDAEHGTLSESPVASKTSPNAAESSSHSNSIHELSSLRPSSASPRMHGSSAPSLPDSMASDHWHRHQGREAETTLHGIPLRSLVRLTSANDPYTSYSFPKGRDAEVATLYSAASIMSVPRTSSLRGPQRTFVPTHTSSLRVSCTEDATVHQVNTARADYEEREIAAEAVPLCGVPDNVIDGDHGLVRSIMLNDRIHALTVDTSGEVAVWDIVRAMCCGKFSPEDVTSASHRDSVTDESGVGVERSPREALEAVRECIEGEAVVVPWSAVDTKTGLLTVHLNEKCFEGEVYADEVGFSHDTHPSDEQRLNIGKWVLRNLFLGFIHEVQRSRRKHDAHGSGSSTGSRRDGFSDSAGVRLRHPSSSDISKGLSKIQGCSIVISASDMIPVVLPNIVFSSRSSPLHTPMITLHPERKSSLARLTVASASINEAAVSTPRLQATNEGGQPSGSITSGVVGDFFSSRARSGSTHAPATPAVAPDDSSVGLMVPGSAKADPGSAQIPSTPGGGLMGILKNFGKISSGSKKPAEGASPTVSGGTVVSETRVPFFDEMLTPELPLAKTPRQLLLSGPLTPPSSADGPTHPLPPNLPLIISDEASSGWTIVYRGTAASAGQDAGTLEDVLPMWVLECLLTNKIPPVPILKIGFFLLPNRDPDRELLPELVNSSQCRLTASRFLRIRRLLLHVQERLERIPTTPPADKSGTPRSSSSLDLSQNANHKAGATSSPPKPQPKPKSEEAFEILCNDVVLPLDITLAAVRQFVWRQSAELVMYYRRKLVREPAEHTVVGRRL